MTIIIRPLQSQEEFSEGEKLQKEIWGFADREITPLNEMVVMQHNGGLVFGAFEGARMVAFCYGMPAYKDKKVYHYSRMLGVLSRFQDQGLGYKMKMFQRNWVSQHQLDLIKWTFDPLQSRNGFFNIEKLGVIIREYAINIYGNSSSVFNAGLETDRFVVEWQINSKRVSNKLKKSGSEVSVASIIEKKKYDPLILTAINKDGYLEPQGVRLYSKAKKVCVELPDNINEMKNFDKELAVTWRFETRKVFTEMFKRGYVIIGFSTGVHKNRRRCYYLLKKRPKN